MRKPTFNLIALLPVALFLLSPLNYAQASGDTAEPIALSKPDLRFTRLGLSDGLSHADVRSIVRDRQGFMWFATWLDGLNRYDGYAFKAYRHDSQDDRSLSFDSVYSIYEDREGVLWVGTHGGGLNRYDRETDSFVRYRHDPGDPSGLPSDMVDAFYEDEDGSFWVGTGKGLCRMDRAAGTFFTYRHDPDDPTSVGDPFVRAICGDRRTGEIWVRTDHSGVSVLDPKTGRFTQLRNDPDDPGSLSDDDVNDIVQDKQGAIWVCTELGLNRWNPDERRFTRYRFDPYDPNSIGSDFVTAVLEDRFGRFWVATADGLDLMDRSTGAFCHYRNDPDDSTTLSGDFINIGGLYEDDTGTLWIATHDGGVSRLNAEPPKFINFRHQPTNARSLKQDTVTALYCDSAGDLWVGTAGGLSRFEGEDFVHFVGDAKNPDTISPGPVWAIGEDLDRQLWVGVNGGGVCRFDGETFVRYRHDPADPRSLGADFMYAFHPGNKDGLWISVHGAGLDRFDGVGFDHFKPDKNDPDSLPESYVGSLYVDEEDCVWMGSSATGLIRLDPATRKATAFPLDSEQPGKIGNWVRDINSDGESIWVAAYTGLFRFDLATRKYARRYTEQDGLASNSVLAVQPDADGNVWFTTMVGLTKLDVRSETVRNYDVNDGLQSAQFIERSRARLPDGRLCFGGVAGFTLFDPKNMPDNPNPPPVVFTEFQLFNKPVAIGENSPLRKAIHAADRITLRYDQNVIRLKFAAINFNAPSKNRYAYKLEGFDDDWRYVDASDRSATYTRLSPGEYTFRVKASNNDGVWNEQGASIQIAVIPPWWQTWWFRSFTAGILLASVYAGYALRIRRMAKLNRTLELCVAERTAQLEVANKELESFSYSVSHDLRAPLRHIDGYVELLVSNCRDGLSGKALHYLDTVAGSARKMGNLIDDLLRFSRTGRAQMNLSGVDMNRIARQIRRRLEETNADRAIEWVVADLPSVQGDESLLRQVWANLLENSVKYTRTRKKARIEINARKDDGEVVFAVADNGVGFDMQYTDKLFGVFQRLHTQAEFEGTGIGLATVQRIIVRHGGRIWAEAEVDKGATFYFALPQATREARSTSGTTKSGK